MKYLDQNRQHLRGVVRWDGVESRVRPKGRKPRRRVGFTPSPRMHPDPEWGEPGTGAQYARQVRKDERTAERAERALLTMKARGTNRRVRIGTPN